MNEVDRSLFDEANPEKWGYLYKIAGYATIVMLIIIPIQIAIFIVFPFPDSIESWFELFNKSWLLGLIHLDLLYIINNIIVAIMYLAFYFSLKKKNESLMIIALVLGLLGISAYLSSNKAFEMLSISNLYYDAASETAKTIFLATGQTMLSSWRGTAFDIYYVLNGITLIIISCVMFKSSIYSNKIAAIGLLSGVLMMIPSTAGTIGLIFSLASLIPWTVFAILVSMKFLQLGKSK
ncbi:DUF4386 family protein [Desulfitobacterium sp. THU1]|uniref:DUF4386 family protein n=1 Tax=Desulfitobacterium sp. THU1 TaxID=3138072 RepID=UPI00311FEB2E